MAEYHCLLLLNFESSVETRNMTAFVSMFLISYRLAIITSPGSIPDALMWIYDPVQLAKSGDTMSNYLESARRNDFLRCIFLQEKKRSGNRRHCKWCMKYKPDRCHHCSICQTCVLRMDHHCPWIINCVGWGNHKYFMLSLLYSCICSIFLGITMMESVLKATKAQDHMPWNDHNRVLREALPLQSALFFGI
ncbi:DHHC zinc finger domain-containing protein [Cardiosporidium cionae]|uniref:Palmitoyltransferase n=1 Tax=Cardiosporidium cionae TaxID=476202 RepID=A0ABQ7JEE0_9APIC|nr:DHHC zinc finger domain-containing protein [Cardiosporidium cionae]|eukprot:KAF8822382.1 DHHC zinc finger domain-containing protein [Cardiosporidium cionae]